jgi:hypothetical protein
MSHETKTEIRNLLNTTLEQNYIENNGKSYKQNDGLAMEAPTSAILAEVFIQHLEHKTIIDILKKFQIQSNLGSQTPRIMNNSVYKQIFRTQSVLDDVLCLELRTRKPSTSWSDKLGVSASAVFVEE